MARSIHRLTALKIKKITKPGFHADGGGLNLRVEPGGSKSWALRITASGKARTIGLGSIHDVTLSEARIKATELRKVARDGGDPIAARDRADEKLITFAEAAESVFAERSSTWRNPKHRAQWIQTLRTYAFPTIGAKRVDQVSNVDVMSVLNPIWLDKPETARRVKQRMHTVFEWCIARHLRETMNPVDAIRSAMPRQPTAKRHFPALPYSEAPAFLASLDDAQMTPPVRLGLSFLIHTAARTGEVIGASWREIDEEEAVWIVPAERMKAGEEHRVPLTAEALAILSEAKVHSLGSSWLFPGRRLKTPLTQMALQMALRRMGRGDITVHGFRSTFRDWAADRTSYAREVCEAALAHQVGSKVEAAYRRSDLFDKRRGLMELWSRYLAEEAADVIRIQR